MPFFINRDEEVENAPTVRMGEKWRNNHLPLEPDLIEKTPDGKIKGGELIVARMLDEELAKARANAALLR